MPIHILKQLVIKWKTEALSLQHQSERTWKELETGEKPQDDKIIYSVYENQAQASRLYFCAEELEKLLFLENL